MRTINHPDIELHEIDRSGYGDQQDNATVGTAAMVIGFADKGPDYTTRWINSINTFVNTYGYPRNEAETYFYNAAYEVLNQGGYLFTSKLPYDNDSLDNFTFTRYDVETEQYPLSSPYDIICNPYNQILPEITVKKIGDIRDSIVYLYKLITETSITDLSKIDDLKKDLLNLLSIVDQEESVYKIGDMVDALDKIKMNIVVNVSINNLLQLDFTTMDVADKGLNGNTKYSDDIISFLKEQVVIPYDCQEYFDSILSQKTSMYCVRYLCNGNLEKLEEYIQTYVIPKNKEVSYDENVVSRIIDRIHLKFKTYNELMDSFNHSKLLSEFNEYYKDLREKSTEEFKSLMDAYVPQSFIEERFETRLTEIKKIDDYLTSCTRINSSAQDKTGMITMEQYDGFKTMTNRVPKNSIYFVDITRRKYQKDGKLEYIGVVPVITTAANAMFYQSMIDSSDENYSDYNIIGSLQNRSGKNSLSVSLVKNLNNDITDGSIAGFTYNLGGEEGGNIRYDDFTTSRQVAEYFPKMKFVNGRVDTENLKRIGVVVLLAYKDTGNDNAISFVVSESFVGSLKRGERTDEGSNIFIDDIINENSKLINCFSNVDFSNRKILESSLFIISNQVVTSLGFYESECAKTISLKKSIQDSLDRIFDRNKDVNTTACDILVDGGVSTIAQFIKQIYDDKPGIYDPTDENSFLFNVQSSSDVSTWKSIIQKYDEFCKNTRRDCMFIADSPRSLVLVGNEKRVRETSHSATVAKQILPKLRYISGIVNSSYGAGYLNWFKATNQYNGELFWCPPSIKAMGVYLYTDARANYWNAPAGLNRGRISDVYDISFNPTDSEQDEIYTNTWNYAVNYPMNGIILEGQKTFQRDKTAFDRVNVRRLFLILEKAVRRRSRYFAYENITDYMLTRFVDTMDPLFRDAQNGGGIREYVIICDERNNNDTTRDNNELHCTIAVKPTKSLEFLVLNFIATSQGASVSEVAESELTKNT